MIDNLNPEKLAELSRAQVADPDNMLPRNNFIHDFIDEDLQEGQRSYGETVHTRFPPEPNGYLHIGHAKAIYINFSTALKYGGLCNLRMDDTNPAKEDEHYVEQIQSDVKWLGYDWGERFYHASDYFPQMYEYALELIEKGLAFVCEQTADEIRESRGTLTEPGTPSPWRDRPIEESLDLFRRMKEGEFPDGTYTLRAKIDMSSGNMNMRDPVIYRISHMAHHRTGDEWCIYPMYDYAHPIEDAIEGITHSLCSLEFEDHRPLYDWVVQNISCPCKPRQIEFARLNLDSTVMSKRKLRKLIESGVVDNWDDPRLPTLSGIRRRGYTPRAIFNFCDRIGVAKVDSTVSYDFLEYCLREDLNECAWRGMAILDPLKLVITNYPEDQVEEVEISTHPDKPELGEHKATFSREVWIEREDFAEVPPKKFRRLYPGNKVRLMRAYIVTCTGCVKDENGDILYVTAEYDPETAGGKAPEGEKIRGSIHWVDTRTAVDAEVRLYDKLFTVEDPDAEEGEYTDYINPESRVILKNCKIEKWMAENRHKAMWQFMRNAYFCVDSKDDSDEHPVFNRSVTLKDSYKPEF